MRGRWFRDWLVQDAAWPDLPFATPARRRWTDYPHRATQVLLARARRRNPPPPPWRRRAVLDWHRLGVGPGPSTRPSRLLVHALTAVWNEDDVIYATVRNLYGQGADRVFVLDDASDDDTVNQAVAAGATVLPHHSDGIYREADRNAAIRAVIAEETDRAGGEVWWLVADADEFPRASGWTIKDLLATAPGWVDVVGSRVIEHLPCPGSSYQPGTHPVAAFPQAHIYHNPYCRLGHWKHQLFRVRTPGDVTPLPGQHTIACADGRRAREWSQDILMHHVPLRDRDRTIAKLRRAAAPGGRYATSPDTFTRWRLHQRLRALDLLFDGRHDLVPSGFPGSPSTGVQLVDWRRLVEPDDRELNPLD